MRRLFYFFIVLQLFLSSHLFSNDLTFLNLIQSPLPVPCDTNPVVLHTTDSSLCVGDSTILYAPLGYITYVWSNGETSASIKIKTAGTYSVIVTDAGGCQHLSNTINVQLFPLPPKPQIGFEGPQGICNGSPATLVTNAQGALLWMNNSITSFCIDSFPGLAWVQVTDLNGCIRRSDTVQVDTLRRVSASLLYSAPMWMCETDSVRVEVVTDNHPYTYMWENGDVDSVSYVIPETQMKGVIVTGDNGCRLKLWPNILESGVDRVFTNNYFDPTPVFYTCPGVPLLMSFTPSPGHTYQWNDGSSTTTNKPLNGSLNGNHYSLKVTWNNWCSRWEEIIVKTHTDYSIFNYSMDTICAGSNINFYTSLNNPIWSNGATTSNLNVQPLNSTTYSVTGTGGNGCTWTRSKFIYVKPKPSLTIAGLSNSVCLNDTLSLTATGAASYSWNHGSISIQGPIFYNTINSSYIYLKTIGANGCTKDSTLQPNRDNSAFFFYNHYNPYICSEDTLNIEPYNVGPGTYSWSNGSGDTSIFISPDTTSSYSCTYTSLSGCTYVSSLNVNVYTDSIPFDTIYYDYFAGDSIPLNSPYPLNKYNWSTGDTTAYIYVHPISQEETYTLNASMNNGCQFVRTYILRKDTLPIPYIIKPDTICFGDSILLTVSEPGTYLWQLGGATTQSIKYKVAYSYQNVGVYYKRNNVWRQILISDTIRPTSFYPYASIQGPDSICEGSVAEIKDIQVNINYKLMWSTGDTTYKISVSPLVTTSYSLLVDNLGCVKTFNHTLKVNQNPPPPTIIGDSIICAGNSATLTATAQDPVVWSSGSVLNTIHISPDVDESYSVYCIDSKNCRSDTTSITIFVGSSAISYITGDDIICKGQSSQLVANGFENCLWNTGDTSTIITVSPIVSSTYTVAGMDAAGCSAIQNYTVTVNELPQPGNFLVCHPSTYCDSGYVVIAMNYFGYDSMVWSTGSTAQGIYFNPTVPQWLYLYGYSKCYSSPHISKRFFEPRGYFNAYIDGDTLVCPGANVSLNAQRTVPGTFLWSNGATTQATFVSPMVTTTYSLIITGNNGCTETLYHTIYVTNNYSDSIVGSKNRCDGDTSTLINCTPVSGANYLWSNGSVNYNSNFTLSSAITPVNVLITLNGGCSIFVSDLIYRHSNALVPSISVPSTICEGDSALISLNGGIQYQWTNGTTGINAAQWVSPTTSTVYEADVIYYNDGSTICSTSVIDSMEVYHSPEITIAGADQYYCPGSTINIVASGANSYSWNGILLNDSISFLATNDSIIQLIGFGNCGFADSLEVLVNVFQATNDTVHTNVSFCYGANSTITSPIIGQTYLWQDGTTAADFNFLCLKDTSFYCFVNISGGCTTYEAIYVSVIAPSDVTISGNTQVCSGESTQLRADGAVSYVWENVYPGKYFHVYPTSDSIVSVVAIDLNGCKDTTIVSIDLLPSFDFDIYGPNIVCYPSSYFSVSFNAPLFINYYYNSPGYNYAWSTGNTTSAILANTVSSPEVSVTVTNSSGCTIKKSKAIQVILPEDLFVKDTMTVCQGNVFVVSPDTSAPYNSFNYGSGWTPNKDLIISANSDTIIILQAKTIANCVHSDTLFIDVKSPVSLTIAGSNAVCQGSLGTWTANTTASLVQWYFPGPHYFVGDTASFIPSVGGIFTIVATDTSGCLVTYKDTLTLVNTPTNFNDSVYLCTGDTANLLVNGGTSWSWSTGANTNSILVNPSVDTTYFVSVNTTGCIGTYRFDVLVEDTLIVSILGDTATCRNEPANLFVNEGVSWLWSTGDNTQGITLPAGTLDGPIFVTVELYSGCYGSGAVFHYNYPSLPLLISGDTTLCTGVSEMLTATQGYASYLWNTGETAQSIFIPMNQGGDYGLSATDYADCVYTDSVNVTLNWSSGFIAANKSTFNCAINEGLIVASTNNSFDSIQWQYSTVLNGVYSDLMDGWQVSGAQTDSLHLLDATFFDGNFFRCKLFSNCIIGQNISDTIRFDKLLQVNSIQSVSICSNEWFIVGTGVYNQTGTYVDTLINYLGCDSIITTHLAVTPVMINTQVSAIDTQLVAMSGYNSYQWYSCATNAPISGANSSVYNAQSNSYVYLVIFDGVCHDTTACIYVGFTGVNEAFPSGTISIRPNPFREQFTVYIDEPLSKETKITIFNNLGQQIISKITNESSIIIPTDYLQVGMYFLKIESGNRVSHFKVLKVN